MVKVQIVNLIQKSKQVQMYLRNDKLMHEKYTKAIFEHRIVHKDTISNYNWHIKDKGYCADRIMFILF